MIENTPSGTAPEAGAPRRSWLAAAGIIAFLAVAGFSVFFEIQQARLSKKLEGINTELKAFEDKAAEEKNSTSSSELTVIKNALKNLEENQIFWSRVIEKIETTIPRLKETNEKVVFVRSYTGDERGIIALNASTRAGAFDPFSDIALTIKAFASEPALQNVFVPSITRTLTPEGATVLSFSLNFKYKKQTF